MNCFEIIWKLKNANYCWHKGGEFIESSSFEIRELEETKWKLKLCNRSNLEKYATGFYLLRDADSTGAEKIVIDYELAILTSDGTVLQLMDKKKGTFKKNGYQGFNPSRNKVFITRPSLPEQRLTFRCKIWKSEGEFSKNSRFFTCTRIAVTKRSFLWEIKDFTTLEPDEKRSYEVQSLETGQQLMRLELFVTGAQIIDEKVRIAVIPNYQLIKTASLQLFFLDASKHLIECLQEEFWYLDPSDRKELNLSLIKRKVIEKKAYLLNDILSLQCEFSFCTGIIVQEENNDADGRHLLKANELAASKYILMDNLKSMLSDSSLSDVKLRTKHETYAAHKCILGARSVVFKAMFSNEMKEKINEFVDIEDLSDDTVLRMLRYIYSADVEELEWGTATELYEAADKYQILSLKEICSSYLKNTLNPSNACEALVLADLHQDKDLKGFVQDFILRHGNCIINSEEWEQLTETYLKLAYETVSLKFKEKLN